MVFANNSKIVAFGAHPDDIEVSMGGTIARLSRKIAIYPIIASIPSHKATRAKEAKNAFKILRSEAPIFLNINPELLSNNRKVITILDKVLNEITPTHIFTHWSWDYHQDHRSLTRAVVSACRKLNTSTFMYEPLIPGGQTPEIFKPQVFIDVSKFIDFKIKAIESHATQLRQYGTSWLSDVKVRARFRGTQSNTKYAESFEVVKLIAD